MVLHFCLVGADASDGSGRISQVSMNIGPWSADEDFSISVLSDRLLMLAYHGGLSVYEIPAPAAPDIAAARPVRPVWSRRCDIGAGIYRISPFSWDAHRHPVIVAGTRALHVLRVRPHLPHLPYGAVDYREIPYPLAPGPAGELGHIGLGAVGLRRAIWDCTEARNGALHVHFCTYSLPRFSGLQFGICSAQIREHIAELGPNAGASPSVLEAGGTTVCEAGEPGWKGTCGAQSSSERTVLSTVEGENRECGRIDVSLAIDLGVRPRRNASTRREKTGCDVYETAPEVLGMSPTRPGDAPSKPSRMGCSAQLREEHESPSGKPDPPVAVHPPAAIRAVRVGRALRYVVPANKSAHVCALARVSAASARPATPALGDRPVSKDDDCGYADAVSRLAGAPQRAPEASGSEWQCAV
ncbi:hypothetical protein VTO73DRAFT_14108 [Trametes versicolor]